jgi:hypothetical protein
MLYDELPKDINLKILEDDNEIDNYLSRLNWQEPWGAGSHFSHLMFFNRLALECHVIDKNQFKKSVDYA